MRRISSRSEFIFKASRAPSLLNLEHVVHLWEFQNGGIFSRFPAQIIPKSSFWRCLLRTRKSKAGSPFSMRSSMDMKHLRCAWCDTPTYIDPYNTELSQNTSTLECRWDSYSCNLRTFFFSARNHDGVLVASCSLQCFWWPSGWTIEKLKKWYIWGQQMLSPSYARLSKSPWQSGAKRRPPSCCLRPVDVETQTNWKVRQNLPVEHAIESLPGASTSSKRGWRGPRATRGGLVVGWHESWCSETNPSLNSGDVVPVLNRRLVRCCWHSRSWIASQECKIYLNSWMKWIPFSGNSEHCSGLQRAELLRCCLAKHRPCTLIWILCISLFDDRHIRCFKKQTKPTHESLQR